MSDSKPTNIVEITVGSAYGRELLYPENSTARLLCRFSGKRTFSRVDLEILELLGFEIQLSLSPKPSESADILAQLSKLKQDGE